MKRKPNKPKPVPKDLREGLQELRYVVENPNRRPLVALRNGVYRQLNPEKVEVLNYPPWEIGYQVVEHPVKDDFFVRNIFLKLPGHNIEKVKQDDMQMMTDAISSELLDIGMSEVDISRISIDTLKYSQHFMVFYRTERNPNLVTKAGGI